jgi:hypothetical protein
VHIAALVAALSSDHLVPIRRDPTAGACSLVVVITVINNKNSNSNNNNNKKEKEKPKTKNNPVPKIQ